MLCPLCGTELAAVPCRCPTCDAQIAAAPKRSPVVSNKVTRVVRMSRPAWADEHLGGASSRPPETLSRRDSRQTTKTPILRPAAILEASLTDGPFGGLVDPKDLPRFAPLSVMDDGSEDRLVLALDQHTQRLVALRIGKPKGDSLARRLAYEAKLLAAVAHPNVVALVGEGRAGGVPWLAYQYCEGPLLRRRMDHGPLPPREAGLIVSQILDGLEALHREGYVHRELSPERVRDSGTGLYKVLGFTRALSPRGQAPYDWHVSADTRYLAPEQSAGERPTAAADIYAAGAVLYELLTGAPPFLTSDQSLLAAKHASEPPVPPGARVADAGPYDDVVLQALAKAPSERFASARAMSDALRLITR